MPKITRLNKLIAVLERNEIASISITNPEISQAVVYATSAYDAVIAEGEHYPWDTQGMRHFLQYLMDRRTIHESGTLAPSVTPLVRIPPNGSEMNLSYAKQALDLGFYGVVWPHISTVEEARSAVAACRYPRMPEDPLYYPSGARGDGPAMAARYWGLSQQEYYAKADVWPLNPEGEILVVIMIEDCHGIENLDEILAQVPGIGAVLIGDGDLSQELGYPRQYNHPAVKELTLKVVEICKRHRVAVGHAHVNAANAQQAIEDGYKLLMSKPDLSFANLDATRRLSGRSTK